MKSDTVVIIALGVLCGMGFSFLRLAHHANDQQTAQRADQNAALWSIVESLESIKGNQTDLNERLSKIAPHAMDIVRPGWKSGGLGSSEPLGAPAPADEPQKTYPETP